MSGIEDIQACELADNLQIERAGLDIKQALAYTTSQGKKQITYVGLKWLALEMSTQNNPLEIVSQSTVLTKYDEQDQTSWHWQSEMVMRNKATGYETLGVSESPFLDNYGNYDNFGKVKSASKAERNCIRKQVPEIMITELLEKAEKEGNVQNVKPTTKPTTSKPTINKASDEITEGQIKYLKYLKYDGDVSKLTKTQASRLIDDMAKALEESKNGN